MDSESTRSSVRSLLVAIKDILVALLLQVASKTVPSSVLAPSSIPAHNPRIWFLPWKAPILNLVDALSNGFFVLLLAVSLAFLEVASEEERHLLEGTAVVFSVAMASWTSSAKMLCCGISLLRAAL